MIKMHSRTIQKQGDVVYRKSNEMGGCRIGRGKGKIVIKVECLISADATVSKMDVSLICQFDYFCVTSVTCLKSRVS